MSIPADKQNTFARATVWSHGVNRFTPVDQDPLEIATSDDLTSDAPTGPDKWLNALEGIQISRTAPITGDEIDEAVTFRSDALPEAVNRLISISSASARYGNIWNPETSIDSQEERLADWLAGNSAALRTQFNDCPYHLWPINLNGHWEVIFMVLDREHPPRDLNDPDAYTRLIAWAMVDPKVEGGNPLPNTRGFDGNASIRRRLILQQMTDIFNSCQLDVEHSDYPQCEKRIWVPRQPEQDNWSSGLRVINFMWEMLRRIEDMELSGIQNIQTLFRPMRPYLNPYSVRAEATGAIAARALEHTNHRGRVVLARVNGIVPRDHPEEAEPQNPRLLAQPAVRPLPAKIPQLFLDGGVSEKEKELPSYQFLGPPPSTELRDGLPALVERLLERVRNEAGGTAGDTSGGTAGGQNQAAPA